MTTVDARYIGRRCYSIKVTEQKENGKLFREYKSSITIPFFSSEKLDQSIKELLEELMIQDYNVNQKEIENAIKTAAREAEQRVREII